MGICGVYLRRIMDGSLRASSAAPGSFRDSAHTGLASQVYPGGYSTELLMSWTHCPGEAEVHLGIGGLYTMRCIGQVFMMHV